MVTMGMSPEPATPLDDPVALQTMIAALWADNARMSATLRAHDQLIRTLRLRIAALAARALAERHGIESKMAATEELLRVACAPC